MQHEMLKDPEQQHPSREETLERLIATAKGEVDAYTLLGPHLDNYLTFTPVGERPQASQATFSISKIERSEALDLAHELAKKIAEDRLIQQESARRLTIFSRLKKFVLNTVDNMGEAGPGNHSSWS